MPNLSDLGRVLLVTGGILVLLGLFFVLAGRVPFLGRLPGDISIRRGNVSVFFPIVTCIVVSIILTFALNLLLFVLRRR